jgi:hypothetical protein
MFLAADVAAARSARTPAVSALGFSVLAHLIPLLLIVMVTARVAPRSNLAQIAADLSPPAVWTPETGGQSSGDGTTRIQQLSSTDESPSRTRQPERSMISQSPAAMYEVPVVTTMPDLLAIPGIVSPLTSVASADGTMPGLSTSN